MIWVSFCSFSSQDGRNLSRDIFVNMRSALNLACLAVIPAGCGANADERVSISQVLLPLHVPLPGARLDICMVTMQGYQTMLMPLLHGPAGLNEGSFWD